MWGGREQGSPEGNCGSLRVSTRGKGVEIFVPAPTRHHHGPLPCISQPLDKGCPQQGQEFLGTCSSGHTKAKQVPAAGRSSSRKEELVVLLGVKVHRGLLGMKVGRDLKAVSLCCAHHPWDTLKTEPSAHICHPRAWCRLVSQGIPLSICGPR